MPTIEIIGPYRFFFYASDRNEPIHVHVKKKRATEGLKRGHFVKRIKKGSFRKY